MPDKELKCLFSCETCTYLTIPFYLEMQVQESCGCFPSCPFSQVSIPQDLSEWSDLTASSHWVSCFS